MNTPAVFRRTLWRVALSATGGLHVHGRLPERPCVVVANHASHADTAVLLAALPARRRPAVAAASDYWFDRPDRRLACRALVGAFPVRRSGGGSVDLAEAAAMLAAGRDVIVYPEGSRSRDGSVGSFHSGAARLAEAAGVPLVPIGIAGTHELLPVHGRLRRAAITVRIGAPVVGLPQARDAVLDLTGAAASPRPVFGRRGSHRRPSTEDTPREETAQEDTPRPDSWLRVRVAAFAGSWLGLVIVALWAFGEAIVLPLLPEFALVILGLAAPRRVIRLALVAATASLLGGVAMYALAAHHVTLPAPLTTPRMHATATSQVALEGAAAVRGQPLSGIPFKVYGAAAGEAHVGLVSFVAESVPARGLRIIAVGLLTALVGAALTRLRRWYPYVIWLFVTVFMSGLFAVVRSWS